MGWMDKLLGRSFDTLRAKGDRLLERGAPRLAPREEQAAKRRAPPPPPPPAAVAARLATCKAKLLEQRTTRAAELAELGHGDEAAELYREALEFADEGEARERVYAAIRDVEAKLDEALEAKDAPLEAEGSDFLGDSPEERLELHLLALDDEERAEQYRSHGPELAAAYVAIEEGQAAEALEPLETLLDASPSALVQRELGRALLLLDRPEDAIPHLAAYTDEADDDVQALHALAEALVAVEDVEGATDLLVAALEAQPDAASVRLRLAELLVGTGEPSEAADLLEEGIELTPQVVILHRVLGIARAAQGEHEAARNAWETALSLRWNLDNETGVLEFDRESAWLLAQLLLARELEPNKALDLVSALALTPDEAERPALLVAKARAHRLLGDEAAARSSLVTARSLVPEDDSEGRETIDGLLDGLGR